MLGYRRNTGNRIISATNCDIEAEVEAGRIQENLYFRFNVVKVKAPPMRDRPNLPRLGDIINSYAKKNKRHIKGIHPSVPNLPLLYARPGNVRELDKGLQIIGNHPWGIETEPEGILCQLKIQTSVGMIWHYQR